MVEQVGHQPNDPLDPRRAFGRQPTVESASNSPQPDLQPVQAAKTENSAREAKFREVWSELKTMIMKGEKLDETEAGDKAFQELKHIFQTGKWLNGTEAELMKVGRLDSLIYTDDKEALGKSLARVATAIEAFIQAFPEKNAYDLWLDLIARINSLDLGMTRQSQLHAETDYLHAVNSRKQDARTITDLLIDPSGITDISRIELRNLLDRQALTDENLSLYLSDIQRLNEAKQYLTLALTFRMNKPNKK